MLHRFERPRSVAEAARLLAAGDVGGARRRHRSLSGARRPADRRAAARHHRASPACAASAASDRGWTIGATTTWTDVVRADLPPLFDALKAAAREVGGVQIQNAGTVAGNVCNASPAADGMPVLLALGAEVELQSARGERAGCRSTQFVLGSRRTARARRRAGRRACTSRRSARGRARSFLKLGGRRYLAISITHGRGRRSTSTTTGACRAPASPSAAARRWRSACRRSRRACVGVDRRRDLAACVEPGDLAPLTPIDDLRASADYRLDATATLLRRALRGASRHDRARPRRRGQIVRLQRQRPRARAGRRSGAAPLRRPARRARPDRHQDRLPRRRLRRLHRAARRRAGVLVHRRRRPVRGPRGDDGRGPGRRRRRAVAAAARLRRPRRGAMRHLHAGHADERRVAAARATPRPSEAEVRDALAGVLCRCTGYTQDRRGGARRRRGRGRRRRRRRAPARRSAVASRGSTRRPRSRGERALRRRRAGPRAADGAVLAMRVDPLAASARLASRSATSRALRARWPGIVDVLSAADVPNNAFAIFPDLRDQPVLADGVARFRGEAVLALVGDAATLARDRRRRPADPLSRRSPRTKRPPPRSPPAERGAPLHARYPDNVLCRGRVVARRRRRGARRPRSRSRPSASFETRHVEHAYIEPEAGYAEVVDGDGAGGARRRPHLRLHADALHGPRRDRAAS